MPTTVFPIGHYTGLRRDEASQVHSVRRGWQQHRLSDDAFGVWVLSHGTPASGKGAWTEDDVLSAAAEAGLSDVPDHLSALTQLGLLATVAGDAEAFARAHRLDVQFVGLGNSPDRPEAYAVGLPGLGPAAILDTTSFELWQWGSLAPTLWHSCQVRASVVSKLDTATEPSDVVGEVLGDLRFLLAHGCAYVDVADEQ